MIRRDYILRMIEEFRFILTKIAALKRDQRWAEVEGSLEEPFRRVVGLSPMEAVALSDTELSARLCQGEATRSVPDKALFLARLFQEAGDAAVAQDRVPEGRSYYLKGLHLLLCTLGGEDPTERPDFVPAVSVFTASLAGEPLPAPTLALLMHHFERTGDFGKAEDALFALLEVAPETPEVVQFGIAFYQRLLGQPDDVLAIGNLPRSEVAGGLAEMRRREN